MFFSPTKFPQAFGKCNSWSLVKTKGVYKRLVQVQSAESHSKYQGLFTGSLYLPWELTIFVRILIKLPKGKFEFINEVKYRDLVLVVENEFNSDPEIKYPPSMGPSSQYFTFFVTYKFAHLACVCHTTLCLKSLPGTSTLVY